MNDAAPESKFEFDGAEGIAFWINKRDEDETAIAVTFEELEELDTFLQKNFPHAPWGHWNEDRQGAQVGQTSATISIDDFHLRNIALSLAHEPGRTSGSVVSAAREYVAFLQGTENEPSSEQHEGNPS